MRVVYGLYEAWLSPSFFLERGKAYNAEDDYVAEALAKHPDAFGTSSPAFPDDDFEEPVRRGPGRPRNV